MQRKANSSPPLIYYYSYVTFDQNLPSFSQCLGQAHHLADSCGAHRQLEIPKSFPSSDSLAPLPTSGHQHVPPPSPGERPQASSHPAAFRLLGPPCSAHSQTRASLSLPHRQTCSGLSELAIRRHQQPTQNILSTFMPSLKAGWSLRTAAPPRTQRICSAHPP